jgi:hypothetical protein
MPRDDVGGRRRRRVVAKRPGRLGFARRLIGWIAAYAFVLHAVFAGAVVAQLAAGAPTPGFEICVDHPDGTPAPAQGQHQHDQCALHCAAVAGLAPLVLALIALLFPLRPVTYTARARFHLAPTFLCRAGRSRAPPLTA